MGLNRILIFPDMVQNNVEVAVHPSIDGVTVTTDRGGHGSRSGSSNAVGC